MLRGAALGRNPQFGRSVEVLRLTKQKFQALDFGRLFVGGAFLFRGIDCCNNFTQIAGALAAKRFE